MKNILFIDIETVSEKETYEGLDDRMKALWDKKSKQIDDAPPEDQYFNKAALFPEFGKIVCISVGLVRDNVWHSKSFVGEDEQEILLQFKTLLDKSYSSPNHKLCAHYGKGFDYPYIIKRMLKHKMEVPSILNIKGKKPWEISLLDTKEIWQFGDFKNSTSLDLLCAFFEIPSPKDEIDGSMVHEVFYKEKDLDKIAIYCEKDVLACAQVYCAIEGLDIVGFNTDK